MSLDPKLQTYREIYYESSASTQNDIDVVFDIIQAELRHRGYHLAVDDGAENLVTALVKYLVESGNAI